MVVEAAGRPAFLGDQARHFRGASRRHLHQMSRHPGAVAAFFVSREGEPGELRLTVFIRRILEGTNADHLAVRGHCKIAGPRLRIPHGEGHFDRFHHDGGNGLIVRAVKLHVCGDGEESKAHDWVLLRVKRPGEEREYRARW